MRIGVDAARAFEPEPTGTERYARELLARMPRVAPEVSWVYFVPRPVSEQFPPNVRIEVLRWPVPFLWHQLRLSLRLLLGGVDAVFVPAHTVPLLRRCPTLTTVHDIGFEDAPELYDPSPGARGAARLLRTLTVRGLSLGRFDGSELGYHRWSLRRALGCEGVLTVSQATADRIAARFPVHPPLSVVPSGAPPVPPDPGQPPYPYPFVLTIGRAEVKKNLAGTIAVFERYRTLFPDAPEHLVWIGRPGYGYPEAVEVLARSPHRDRIHLLGYRPDAERDAALHHASALLFLSRYEGFGFPLLEAMGAGVPVIASNLAALREVGADAVRFVDPDDTEGTASVLRTVLTNPGVRSELAAAGRRRYAEYDWDRTARATVAAIVSTAASHRTPGGLRSAH